MAVTKLPLLSALVSLTAAGYLLARYYKTGSLLKLVLAASMNVALIGQALECSATVYGWTEESYKLYYFTSPVTPVIMGVGALMLLSDRQWYELFGGYVVAISLVLLLLAATAPVDKMKFALGPLIGSEAMPGMSGYSHRCSRCRASSRC